MTAPAGERYAGTYFDGRDGRAHRVTVRRVGLAHFIVEGENVRRGGAIAHLTLTPRLARVARTLEFADGARLQLAVDAPIDAWFPSAGRLEKLVDRLERHVRAVAAAMLICVGALAGGAIWGVPWLADRIASRIPPQVEHALGEQVLSSLDNFGVKPSAIDEERRNELVQRFAALAQGLDGASAYRVEFRNAPGIGANAFALPGGTVVVTDQLVAVLGDDREFDAVVAHEIGHQQHRHVLRQTLRGSFVAIVAALFAGDVSSASAVVVAVPTFLLSSHYSRGFEEEADAFAFDLLSRHAESPHWFTRAMGALQQAHPQRGRFAYLSSHPQTDERIAAAETAAHAFAAGHPEICPNDVCPGDVETDADDDECDDCADDAKAHERDKPATLEPPPRPQTSPHPADADDPADRAPTVSGSEPSRAFVRDERSAATARSAAA